MKRSTSIAGGLFLWLVIFFFEMIVGGTYPPRRRMPVEFYMMALVPLGAVLLARPRAPWRHYLYLGMAGTLPFFLNLWGKQSQNMYVMSMNGYAMPLSEFLAPPLALLVSLPCVTVVFGLLIQDLFRKHKQGTANV